MFRQAILTISFLRTAATPWKVVTREYSSQCSHVCKFLGLVRGTATWSSTFSYASASPPRHSQTNHLFRDEPQDDCTIDMLSQCRERAGRRLKRAVMRIINWAVTRIFLSAIEQPHDVASINRTFSVYYYSLIIYRKYERTRSALHCS